MSRKWNRRSNSVSKFKAMKFTINRDFFQAVADSVLLYRCTIWTLTKCIEKKLDGNFTRMLQAVLNKFWKQHPTKQQFSPVDWGLRIRQLHLYRFPQHMFWILHSTASDGEATGLNRLMEIKLHPRHRFYAAQGILGCWTDCKRWSLSWLTGHFRNSRKCD